MFLSSRKILRSQALVAISALILLTAGFQAKAETKIAVVDYVRAALSTEEGKLGIEKLQTELGPEQERLQKLQKDFKALQERFEKDAAIMSTDEQNQVQIELREKQEQFDVLRKQLQRRSQIAQQAIIQKMQAQIRASLEALVKENGYDIVLRPESVVFFDPAIDITPKLTEKLNAEKAK